MLFRGWGDGGGDPADPPCPPLVTAVVSGQLQQVVQERLDLPPPNIKQGEGRVGDTQGWGDKGGHPGLGGQGVLMGGGMDGGDTGAQVWGWRDTVMHEKGDGWWGHGVGVTWGQ